MSWIEDVRAELAALDGSTRSLRRFGLAVGGVLAAAGAWLAFRRHLPAAGAAVGGPGLALLALGALAPRVLGPVHRAWMALAFALGWVTSRVVLLLLFAAAVVPVALLARLAGKRFLELRPDPSRPSYWERRDPSRRTDYEKMY